MRARTAGFLVVASVAAPCVMSACIVPEATIESTGSMGSMGSVMPSGVSSGAGGDPNAFSPHVEGPIAFGGTPGGAQEIAPTGNPMQRHLAWIPLPQNPMGDPGRWYAFYLEGGKLATTRLSNGTWNEVGSVVLDPAYTFEDGRAFGADLSPVDASRVHFAVDWPTGSVHVEGRAPDDPTMPFVFEMPVTHAQPSGVEFDGAVTVAMPDGTVHDFGAFQANGTPCTSCVATRSGGTWTQKPLDFMTGKTTGLSPRGAVRLENTPLVAWPLLGGLATAHIFSPPMQWSGMELSDGAAQVAPVERTWAMCSKPKNGSTSLDAHALIANGATFTHVFTNSGMWSEFPGGVLGAPPNADVSELFMVCSLDVLYAFTLDAAGALLGTEYVVAEAKWKNWTVLVPPPSNGQRCFLSGFDQATHGEIGLVFSETASCTTKGPNTYYAVFLRIG